LLIKENLFVIVFDHENYETEQINSLSSLSLSLIDNK